jgi:hypothetical protein
MLGMNELNPVVEFEIIGMNIININKNKTTSKGLRWNELSCRRPKQGNGIPNCRSHYLST